MSGDSFSLSAGIFKFMPRKIKMTTFLLVLILLLLPDEQQQQHGILLVRAENQQEDGAPTLQPSRSPTLLSSNEFAMGIANGEYDVILDVRTRTEWNTGHIEGATFAESLASFGTIGHMGAVPSDLAGCEFCTIAVYCRSGARARTAIQVLLNNGFQGKLYNGQGTNQWTSAGFSLVVTGESVVPPCTIGDSCRVAATTAPSLPNYDGDQLLRDRKRPDPVSKDTLKIKRTKAGTDAEFTQIGIRGGGRRLANDIPLEMVDYTNMA